MEVCVSAEVEIAIIGAGPGGISAGHHLLERGITDFVILERADDFGGTWRDNHYPGLAVDLPGVFYQLSFARNPDWSRVFPTGPEIGAYLRRTARDLGLYAHLKPGCTVLRQLWQQGDGRWRLEIAGGSTVSARFVINAVGGYIDTDRFTALPGVEDFAGTVLRPNDWDDGYDVSGKRVAVVGTGSSGVQIGSALAARAAHLDVYQRTPAWILPKIDFDVPEALKRVQRVPGVLALLNLIGRMLMDAFVVIPLVHVLSRLPERVLTTILPIYDIGWRAFYRALLRVVVDDPAYRRALVPRYGMYAKRPVISSTFLPALNRDTVNLITTPIQRVTKTGVLTQDSIHHPADLLVLATGYELYTDPETHRPGTVVGRDGFDLAEQFRRHGLRSYAGTCYPRVPNRWDLVGPRGYVGLAWTDWVETTAAHAVRMIELTRRSGPDTAVEVTQSAFDAWNARMDRRARTYHIYVTKCSPPFRTYFVNSHGETLYYRPQTIFGSRWFARHSPVSDYQFQTVGGSTEFAALGRETQALQTISTIPVRKKKESPIR
ncbi:monooxygenase [Mycobacterium marseillense]|nr:monooxygenase [Mycobacterium marseillense]